jgi:hypothetical protein
VEPRGQIQIVQNPRAKQQWIGRIVGNNGEEVWRTSENLTDRSTVENALSILGTIDFSQAAIERVPTALATNLKKSV